MKKQIILSLALCAALLSPAQATKKEKCSNCKDENHKFLVLHCKCGTIYCEKYLKNMIAIFRKQQEQGKDIPFAHCPNCNDNLTHQDQKNIESGSNESNLFNENGLISPEALTQLIKNTNDYSLIEKYTKLQKCQGCNKKNFTKIKLHCNHDRHCKNCLQELAKKLLAKYGTLVDKAKCPLCNKKITQKDIKKIFS